MEMKQENTMRDTHWTGTPLASVEPYLMVPRNAEAMNIVTPPPARYGAEKNII